MILLFLGPPGSGKGTQAKLLVKKLNSHYFESGDILREKAEEKSSLGREIDRIMHQKGEYVSDRIMEQILRDWLTPSKIKDGIVFDGFPRTIDQYKALEKILTKRKAAIDKVIYLTVTQREVVRRLSARRICPQCDSEYNLVTNLPKKDELCDRCQAKLIQRQDDSLQVIRKRLRTYHRLTQPLVDYIRQKGILEEVDGERQIELIYQDIVKRLKR